MLAGQPSASSVPLARVSNFQTYFLPLSNSSCNSFINAPHRSHLQARLVNWFGSILQHPPSPGLHFQNVHSQRMAYLMDSNFLLLIQKIPSQFVFQPIRGHDRGLALAIGQTNYSKVVIFRPGFFDFSRCLALGDGNIFISECQRHGFVTNQIEDFVCTITQCFDVRKSDCRKSSAIPGRDGKTGNLRDHPGNGTR